MVLLSISCSQRILCNSEQITNFKGKKKKENGTERKKHHSKDTKETIKMEPKRYKVKHYRNDYSSYERDVLQMV